MTSPPERILITGGAGFIGSHTCLVLLEAGRGLLDLVGGCVTSTQEGTFPSGRIGENPLCRRRA